MDAHRPEAIHSRWLARDFIEFDATEPLDLVIVGSGYGAAMAAATFAGNHGANGTPLRIALLERGHEYLPGAFPSSVDELPGHVRVSRAGQAPIGRRDGLFDLRLAGDVAALVGNGLGGGSLINAGVMVEPRWGTFDSRLPDGVEQELRNQWVPEARRLLGGEVPDTTVKDGWAANTIERHPQVGHENPLCKTQALHQLAAGKGDSRAAAITVRMAEQDNQGQAAALTPCSLCGDCLTGCNVGAKVSLDTNLLPQAQQQGLAIYTSASVLRLQRHKGLWALTVVHTNPQVQGRRGDPVTVLAHKVVLAAGSLGSTEILLRSQAHAGGPVLSPRLGDRFSLNGDNTATVRFKNPVNALADERHPLIGEGGMAPQRIGPQITQILEWPGNNRSLGFLVQEFAIPAALRGLFQEIVGTRGWIEQMSTGDFSCHASAQANERDPLALDETGLERELMVGLIGHDSASGRIHLPSGHTGEGSIGVQWADVAQDPAMAEAFKRLEKRVHERLKGDDPRIVPNPLWRLLPESLRPLLGRTGGGAFTVHPLGGCPMGETAGHGVVNKWNAAFNLAPGVDDWQGSLLVLDGAAVPASLGANPALTIASLSLRASRHWQAAWGWRAATSAHAPITRPRARAVHDCRAHQPPAPRSTELQVVERLAGVVQLQGPGGPEAHYLELSFHFMPCRVQDLTAPLKKRMSLEPSPPPGSSNGVSTLKLYPLKAWREHSLHVLDDGDNKDAHARVIARLEGHMDLLARQPGGPVGRTVRALLAVLRNRGLRDMQRDGARPSLQGVLTALRLASQAGEVRLFEYDTRVSEILKVKHEGEIDFWTRALREQPVRGRKRFTYAWGESPWNQLLYLKLLALGKGLLPDSAARPTLKLDARFLAHQGNPLARITRQHNQVRALIDLTHFGLYFTRLFLKLHLWQLRTPDPSSPGKPQGLPDTLDGMAPPEICELPLEPDGGAGGAHGPAVVRLTRYRSDSQKPPLVFIHGYSASGTTFAHNAVPNSAARYFSARGRDVWVLDLRTSAGLPTAYEPWAFEDVAWADIPLAIDHIARHVAHERGQVHVPVDVFAHCIGGVMLSMALLSDPTALPEGSGLPTRYPKELGALHHNIRKLVLSQKGFVVEYSDANLLRSYLINFFKGALRGGYRFRPPPAPGMRDRLLDAFLATLPYPPHEWPLEHPWFGTTPWAATRRRMDALYERTFNIEHMPAAVLSHIDDFFGPLNLTTVSQTIHFARDGLIAPESTAPISLSRLKDWPRGGTLLLSAQDNGMVDPHTSLAMENRLTKRSGIPNVQRAVLAGGHQDILIGRHAHKTWERVEGFLDAA